MQGYISCYIPPAGFWPYEPSVSESQCTWFWRPYRIHPSLAGLTATQLRSARGLIAVSQCTDFATCQFACETRPSFRELQEQGQVLTNDVNLDDPTVSTSQRLCKLHILTLHFFQCDYVVMPSADTKNQFSFLFSMRQGVLKNTTYARSVTYDSFELICKSGKYRSISQYHAHPYDHDSSETAPPSTVHSSPPSGVVVAAPPGQPRHTRKREASETVQLRECKRGGDRVECSDLIHDTKLDVPCVQIRADKAYEHLTISMEAKKPIWFTVEQPGLDGMEEHVPLTPGRKHVVDMKLESREESESSKCGPPTVRGRRCAASCNDRLAIDACGCSISADPDAGYINSLVSVPLCSDQQLKACVLDQLRSDAFFSCMNECKKECSAWRPFEIVNAKGSKLPSDDYLTLDLHFAKTPTDIQAEAMWSGKGIEQMMQVWAPALMVVMLSLALVAVIYVSRRR